MTLKNRILAIVVGMSFIFATNLYAIQHEQDAYLDPPGLPQAVKVIGEVNYQTGTVKFFGKQEQVFVSPSTGKSFSLKGIKTLDGKAMDLSQLNGKFVFLNLWASWCVPCRVEMPTIQRLYDKLKSNKNIVFVVLSDDEPGDVQKLASSESLSLPFYVTDRLNVAAVPITLIIAPTGDIVFWEVGAYNWDSKNVLDFFFKLENGFVMKSRVSSKK